MSKEVAEQRLNEDLCNYALLLYMQLLSQMLRKHLSCCFVKRNRSLRKGAGWV